MSELLSLAKGENIFADLGRSYGQVDFEEVVLRKPQVILELAAEGEERNIKLWESWPQIPAVRENRIYLLQDRTLLVPGPDYTEGAWHLAEILHGVEK